MRLFLFALLFSSTQLLACSQDNLPNRVPALVNNTLLAKFPDAINLQWSQKPNHLYEAHFRLAFTEYSALVDAAGEMIMYKSEVTGLDLPHNIQTVLQTDYRTYLIEDLQKVEKAGNVFYQVELDKGNQVIKRVFAPNGHSIKNVRYWD